MTHGDSHHVSRVAAEGLALLVEIEQRAFASSKSVRLADVHVTLQGGSSVRPRWSGFTVRYGPDDRVLH
jgi:hypothetical protein